MIELLQVLEYCYMIVKHTVSKLMYTKNMYQHKMTQECILPQTSNFSQIRAGAGAGGATAQHSTGTH